VTTFEEVTRYGNKLVTAPNLRLIRGKELTFVISKGREKYRQNLGRSLISSAGKVTGYGLDNWSSNPDSSFDISLFTTTPE
jgi:hypothetical protein